MLVTLDTIMEIYKTLTKNVTKKDPCEGVNNISHSTYCAAREWSFDLLNFSFLKYFCYHHNIKSQTQFWSNQGEIFLISSGMLCMHSSNLIKKENVGFFPNLKINCC